MEPRQNGAGGFSEAGGNSQESIAASVRGAERCLPRMWSESGHVLEPSGEVGVARGRCHKRMQGILLKMSWDVNMIVVWQESCDFNEDRRHHRTNPTRARASCCDERSWGEAYDMDLGRMPWEMRSASTVA